MRIQESLSYIDTFRKVNFPSTRLFLLNLTHKKRYPPHLKFREAFHVCVNLFKWSPKFFTATVVLYTKEESFYAIQTFHARHYINSPQFFYAGKQSSLMIPDSSFFSFLFSFLYCIIVWLATSVLYLFCCVLAILWVFFLFTSLCPREGGQSICQQHSIAK